MKKDRAMATKKTTTTAAAKKPAAAKRPAVTTAKVAAKKPAAPAAKVVATPSAPPAKVVATLTAPAKVVATPSAPAPKKPTAKAAPGVGIAFKSAGFRLTVLNELLDLGHFADGFEEAQESAEKVEDYDTDPRVQKFLDGIVLTEELLAQVVKIGPDGGDEIYAGLVPVWDGEDDRFDIGSLEDVRLLPNLERVSLFAVVSEGIDLAPLRDVSGLKHVNVNLTKSWVQGWNVLDELAARGVEVTRS